MARETLQAAAMQHLRAQHQAAREVAARHGIHLDLKDAEWNSVPLAVHWTLLPEFTVNFFGYSIDEGVESIRYAFGPRTEDEFGYWEASPPELTSHGWSSLVTMTFDSRLASLPQPYSVLEQKARFALQQHMAIRGFFRKLSWIEDLAAITVHIREGGTILGGRSVDAETYYRMCMVLILGAMESLLHDLFFAYRDLWFEHVPEGRKRIRALRAAVRHLQGRKWRTEWRPIRGSTDPIATLDVFLGSGPRTRISFQDLRGRRGVKWAYKAFLDIQLPTALEAAEKDAWQTLLEVGRHRHASLHPGDPLQVTRDEVNRALDKARKAECALLQIVMGRAKIDRTVRL